MGLSIDEQETCVNFMRGDDRARIYTSDTTIMTKLNKLVKLQDSEWELESVARLESGEVVGKIYTCPVSFVSFRSKRISRVYTEEQKKELSKRLRKTDSSRKNSTS